MIFRFVILGRVLILMNFLMEGVERLVIFFCYKNKKYDGERVLIKYFGFSLVFSA